MTWPELELPGAFFDFIPTHDFYLAGGTAVELLILVCDLISQRLRNMKEF